MSVRSSRTRIARESRAVSLFRVVSCWFVFRLWSPWMVCWVVSATRNRKTTIDIDHWCRVRLDQQQHKTQINSCFSFRYRIYWLAIEIALPIATKTHQENQKARGGRSCQDIYESNTHAHLRTQSPRTTRTPTLSQVLIWNNSVWSGLRLALSQFNQQQPFFLVHSWQQRAFGGCPPVSKQPNVLRHRRCFVSTFMFN